MIKQIPFTVYLLFAIAHGTIRAITNRFLRTVIHRNRLDTNSHNTGLTIKIIPLAVYFLFAIHHSTCLCLQIIPVIAALLLTIQHSTVFSIAYFLLATVFRWNRLYSCLHHTVFTEIIPLTIYLLLTGCHSTCFRIKIVSISTYGLFAIKHGAIFSIAYSLRCQLYKTNLHHTIFTEIIPFAVYLLLTDGLIPLFIIIIGLAFFCLPSGFNLRFFIAFFCVFVAFLARWISTDNWRFIIICTEYIYLCRQICFHLIIGRHIRLRNILFCLLNNFSRLFNNFLCHNRLRHHHCSNHCRRK